MATSTNTTAPVLKNFIRELKSKSRKDLLETLTGLRNYLRSRREASRIEKFRKLGGLEILVKILRDVSVRTESNATGLGGKCTDSHAVQKSDKGRREMSDDSSRLELLNMAISTLATCCTESGSRQQGNTESNHTEGSAKDVSKDVIACPHCLESENQMDSSAPPKPDKKETDDVMLHDPNPSLDEPVQSAGGLIILGKVLQNEVCWNIINRAARAVANLAKDPDISTSFHKQEFIPCLVKHLTKSEEPYASYSLVRALRTLSDTSDHRLSVINQGGVKAILGTLEMNDDNVTGVSIETLAEMTHPYLFNHLKKPSWRALWDTVGSQAADTIPGILKLRKTAKQSISDQALVLLNNLMNSKAVRLAFGRCGEIPEFVKLCKDASLPNLLPYLQCFALCCKESVNRAKVRQSDGLDVLLNVLKKCGSMQERHVALAGLVHFYHDNLALKYLCTKGLIKSITKYLGEYLYYLQGDMKVSQENFSRPDFEVPARCSEPGDEAVHVLSEPTTPVRKFASDESGSLVDIITLSASPQKTATSTKTATPLRTTSPSGGTSEGLSSSCEPASPDTATETWPSNSTSESPRGGLSTSIDEDSSICDEYSKYIEQNAAVYSPPRVDWSSVFACREQQGYRGLSPQSDLSSRSNSIERDIPKYQYSLDWSMSPRSDASWAMAGEDPEVFQYSPVVSDEEEAKEDVQEDEEDSKEGETMEMATSHQTTPENPSKVASGLGNLGVTDGIDKYQSPSSSKKFASGASSPSLPIYSPAKRSRSPSVDSCYDSEAPEDFSDEDQSKPEGYALHLLSKCSYIDDTLEFLAVFEVIDVLLKLVLHVPQFRQRSTRILNRILSNRLTFEQLVKEGIPRFLKTSWKNVKSQHNFGKLREESNVSSEKNTSEPSTSVSKTSSSTQGRLDKTEKRLRTDEEVERSDDGDGKNDPDMEEFSCPFLDKLVCVCDSKFGLGVLAHGVTSPNLSQRLAVLDAIFILCRSQSGLRYLLIDSGALDVTIYFLRRKDLSDGINAIIVSGLQSVSHTLRVKFHEGDRLDAFWPNVKHRKLAIFDVDHNRDKLKREASSSSRLSCEYKLSEKCKDLRLVLSDKNFLYASREFLCQRSEYFSLLLQGSYKESRESEVAIPDISRPTLEMVLHHLYGCQWHQCNILNNIDLNSGMELLAASGRFLLPDLQRTVAESSLQDQITSDNVATVCIFASVHGCQYLWSYCLKFMLVNNQVGVTSFQKLSNSSIAKSSFSKMKSIIKNALKLVS